MGIIFAFASAGLFGLWDCFGDVGEVVCESGVDGFCHEGGVGFGLFVEYADEFVWGGVEGACEGCVVEGEVLELGAELLG